jgi:TPR repeat protein
MAMAEVAHDASGPASPIPGDIAPQQASRPDSPDRGKLRVFISYSREDLYFADQLNAALDACGFECFIDRHGISGGEDWKRRLGNLIREADTVVFVLSPTSARSEICAWEVEEATRLGKRILPVNCAPLKGASPPPRLRDLNYIFFHADPKTPDLGFGTGLAKLITALNTDFEWLREHTRYLQRATEWDRGGRPVNRLLSGDDIAEAKAWVARRPKNAPEPTALQLDFIRASEEEAEARLSEQRKQLEAMAAAQAERETALHDREEALKQAADAQRRRAKIRNIAFVVGSVLLVAASVLAAVAGWFGLKSVIQKYQADEIAIHAGNIFLDLGERMDAKTQQKAAALFQAAAEHGNTVAMWNLGVFYQEGYGVPQDYAKAREWYEKAVAKDHADAMNSLGVLYDHGLGVPHDYAKAREWFEKSAAKGHPRAMSNLGVLYENGRGVPQDYDKARELYEKAAATGDGKGMSALGVLYASGQGMPQDYAKAGEWFEKAAAKGDAEAIGNLGVLYQNGLGVPQDYAKAREWYEKAVAKDNAHAMGNLGTLYEKGYGVPQDYAKAREWYEKAAARGDASAKKFLEELPIREAVGTGRYADALQLQEAFAAKVEAEDTKRDGKPGEQTANALNGVVWVALFAKDFPKALAVADRSHALFPASLSIESNRAHALMFTEHAVEGKALYLAHKGKPISEERKELWERAIVEDFAEFRKAGLTHPMMADIEKELGVSP